MYSNKFVFSIKVDGCTLQELANGEIHLPINSEYAIWLQNKHDCKAVAQIFIDGENVSDGGYIIPARYGILIKRHSNADRAFKFVDLNSEAASNAGKNGPNTNKQKGVVEVRFFLEKKYIQHSFPITKSIVQNPWVKPEQFPYPYAKPTIWYQHSNDTTHLNWRAIYSTQKREVDEQSMNCLSNSCIEQPIEGCTVAGISTGQIFDSAHLDIEDTFTAMKVFLIGYNDITQRNKDVPVEMNRNYCPQCGAKVHKKDKFCSICGKKL